MWPTRKQTDSVQDFPPRAVLAIFFGKTGVVTVSLYKRPGNLAGCRSARGSVSMSNRITKAMLVLVGLTIASQALAGQSQHGANQPQQGAARSYWQNLKRELTAPSTTVPAQPNQPAAVTSVRG
jgi:hypothetical protein